MKFSEKKICRDPGEKERVPSSFMKKSLSVIIRLALFTACVIYLKNGLNFERLGEALLSYSPLKLIICAVVMLVTSIPSALRLQYLLTQQTTVWQAFNAELFGFGVNNLLPAKLGEIAKVVYLRYQGNISVSHGLSAAFWERFADLNVLLILSAIVSAGHNLLLTFAPLAIAVIAMWGGLFFHRAFSRQSYKALRLIPMESLREILRETLDTLVTSLAFRNIFALLLYTCAAWVAYIFFFYAVLVWAAGLDLTLLEFMTVFALTTLSFALPTTPASVGLFEAAVVLALGFAGVDKNTALSAAILLHLAQFLPTTIWALVVMGTTQIGFRRLCLPKE